MMQYVLCIIKVQSYEQESLSVSYGYDKRLCFLQNEVSLVLVKRNIYFIVVVKFSNRSIQNFFNVDKGICMDFRKLSSKFVT